MYPYELYAVRLCSTGQFVAATADATGSAEFMRMLDVADTPLEDCRVVRQCMAEIEPREYEPPTPCSLRGHTLFFERVRGGKNIYYMPSWAANSPGLQAAWDEYMHHTSNLKGLARLLV